MKSWTSRVRNEKGVALPLALFTLVALSAFVLAFLSMGGMEPQISRNLSDSAQGRYAAEAGIEWAFDTLVKNPNPNSNWSQLLQSPNKVANSNPQAVWLTDAPGGMPAQVTLPGLSASVGTYTVQIRNDILPTDTALTGVPPDPSASATTDTNSTLIVTATGTQNGVSRQIQVVMRGGGAALPFPGAYNMPGLQADLAFWNPNFNIDGRDWKWNPANKIYELNTDQSKMKYGIAVQPGIQQDINQTYEKRAETQLTAAIQKNVIGKDQTKPAGWGTPNQASTTGLNTVAPDAALNPTVMQNFLTMVAKSPGTAILQSTMACPMRLTGNKDSSKPQLPQLTNGCGVDKPLDLGNRDNPKLVYVRGDEDKTSKFVGLGLDGQKISGAGILIVEDGDLTIYNQFDWEGIVIVTGKYVSSIFREGSKVNVYGAVVSNETIWNEAFSDGSAKPDGEFKSANAINLRYSQENLDLVQQKLFPAAGMSAWREL